MTQKNRTLLIRLGAYGDCIIVTPIIKYLATELNEEVYVLTSEQGQEVFANNPYITKIIPYERNSVPGEKLGEFFEGLKKGYECDRVINMCESIEWALALHYADPRYNYPKYERKKLVDVNYYDYSFKHAGFPDVVGKGKGDLYFTPEETEWAEKFRARFKKKFLILWGLSGSGRNKLYPFTDFVMGDLLRKYENLAIVTVGDPACKILEFALTHPRVERYAGVWSMRKSMIMAKYADLVVSPDTGLLHASGCFDTPKVGLLGHSTIENITKYFTNDYSVEAKCDCAPCFRLIYNATVQCPLDPITRIPICMTEGLPATEVKKKIEGIIDARK